MKKLMFALACAASAAVMGEALQSKATFEDIAVKTTAKMVVQMTDGGKGTATDGDGMYWGWGTSGSTNDASVVSDDGPHKTGGSKFLKLETNGDELQRNVKTDGSDQSVGTGLYIDTLVQFTATPEAPTTIDDAGAKLAIWLQGEGTQESPYALKVRGGYVDASGNDGDATVSVTPTTYTLQLEEELNTTAWYRLTVQAIANVASQADDNIYLPGFVVKINGTAVAALEKTFSTVALEYLCPSKLESDAGDWLSAADLALVEGGMFIPSAIDSHSTEGFYLSSVGFQGSGAIDNVEILNTEPVWDNPITFTIDLENVTAVTYTINGENPTEIKAKTSFEVAAGATVAVTKATPASDYWLTVPLPISETASESENSENKITVSTVKKPNDQVVLAEGNNVPDDKRNDVLAWAKGAGATLDAVEDSVTLFDNYLLDVTDLNVAPQIEIVSIDTTFSPVKVTVKVTDANGSKYEKELNSDTEFNGGVTLQYQAAESLEDLDEAAKSPTIPVGAGSQFIRAVVE